VTCCISYSQSIKKKFIVLKVFADILLQAAVRGGITFGFLWIVQKCIGEEGEICKHCMTVIV
jgi:uncharacterized protein (DUF697 family)